MSRITLCLDNACQFSWFDPSRIRLQHNLSRSQLTLPNGVTVAYSYDKDSHITGLTYSAGSTQLGALTYSYDPDGRRTAVGGSLAAVTLPSNVAGGTGTAYNADNEQSKFNATSPTYDADGNLTRDGTNAYTWDARGHLTQITQGRTTTASFQYDAFGRRSQKTIGSRFLLRTLRTPAQNLPAPSWISGTARARERDGMASQDIVTDAARMRAADREGIALRPGKICLVPGTL